MDPRLARPKWRGRTNIDALTIAALEKAERIAGHTFTITQGSYQSSVAASAGTHDKGGAVDLAWTGKTSDILALRKAGFAAWHRSPAQGPWSHHIHAVVVDHPLLAPSAARQVTAYRNGRNGLSNNGPDDGPRINPIPVYVWEDDDMANSDEILAELKIITKRTTRNRDLLLALARQEQARDGRSNRKLDELIAATEADD